MSRLCSGVLAEVRVVIERLLGEMPRTSAAAAPRLLDVGCWDGETTARYARACGAGALGVEIFEGPAAQARARGVEVASIDLEAQPMPWPDASVDIVVANQVLEHLKNVWLPMDEMFRVLRPGGALILSVPNLASLHNRVLLALGFQPTSIATFGPHVRGFTRREFERFVAFDGALAIERSLGVGFLPLTPPWTRPLSRLWPGGSHTLVVVARKPRNRPAPWSAYLERERQAGVQTFYGPTTGDGGRSTRPKP
jgi:SAM-dependent methyltransferase